MIVLLLGGCSESSKSEAEIVADLQGNSFFLDGTDVTITEWNIIKRRTDFQDKSDYVYINVTAGNDFFIWNRSYLMTYGLYNEGWILDYVNQYEEETWTITPLQGLSDKEIDDFIAFEQTNEFDVSDKIEIVDRTTELNENVGVDKLFYEVKREHLFSTEVLSFVQTWYFDSYSYGFYTTGLPMQTDRTVYLNENIIGTGWYNLARYSGTQNLFADQFDIRVDGLTEDGLLLTVTKKDIWSAYWNNLDSPPETSAQILCTTLIYFLNENRVGVSLSGLISLLYPFGDEDDFGASDYLLFDLDNHVGYIESLYSIQSGGIEKKAHRSSFLILHPLALMRQGVLFCGGLIKLNQVQVCTHISINEKISPACLRSCSLLLRAAKRSGPYGGLNGHSNNRGKGGCGQPPIQRFW